MKKIAAMLLAIAMLILPAFAMQGEGYPPFDGNQAQNSMGGQFGSEKIALAFDASADYSYLDDGYIQGCFFAFDAAEEYYLELYLLLPEKVQAGDVLTPATAFASGADSCSVTLFEVDEDNNEQAWFAGQLLGESYPDGSSYTITIDQAEYNGQSVVVQGSIQAQLSLLQGELPAGERMSMDVQFDFELPLDNRKSDAQTELPAQESQMPAPKFTLPPDHISL